MARPVAVVALVLTGRSKSLSSLGLLSGELDDDLSAMESCVVELLKGSSGLLWSFEVNEAIILLDRNSIDSAEFSEEMGKVCLGGVLTQSGHEKLLGCHLRIIK
jgi:hypothetical protein